MALEHGVMLSKTSPAFLHANSTSHTWCFSAIAEIIDNAYDPDVKATELRIDKLTIKDVVCLAFTDNGSGMTPEKLHRMLSFGYCEKVEVKGHKPVGQYGNGFKSGSMRLGKDAIVFTKCKATWSVGFLSQTYLAAISADTVLVPIITFDKSKNVIVYRDDTEGSLRSIFTHSIFTTLNSILKEYAKLDCFDTGTRIIIYNLTRGTGDGMLELDFNSNRVDIINSEHHEFDQATALRLVKEYTPEYRRSLREYCSILFLKPRMKIIIRGEKVQTKLISKSLRQMEVALYRPRFLQKPVKIIFGFGTNNEDCGMMMYHRNRLIKAYERVGCQKQQNGQGTGIVGVVEVDFLEPVHNKQDFSKTDRFNACMNVLAQKLNDYCQETTTTTNTATTTAPAQWNWAQCDNPNCLKWRRMPQEVTPESLPNKWFCYMNLDPTHNRCDIEEEPEDEDALLEQGVTYEKRVKKQKNMEQQSRTQTITQREESLRQKEEELLRVQREIEQVHMQRENNSDGLTRAELQQARQALEQAKHREEEQRRVIEELKSQKHQMEEQQRRLGNAIMGDTSSIAAISNIALNGVQASSASRRKRKSDDGTPRQLAKKSRSEAPDNHPPREIIEGDDETQDVKPHLVVRLPTKSKNKNRSDVIVIDSDSDGGSESPEDVKPDIHQLASAVLGSPSAGEAVANGMPRKKTASKKASMAPKSAKGRDSQNGLAETSATPTSSSAETSDITSDNAGASANPTGGNTGTSAIATSGNAGTSATPANGNTEASATPVASKSAKPHKNTRSVRTQTLFPENADSAVLQLNTLRRNVAKLLKVILPDMDAFVNIPMENVDSALVEVLKVNDIASDEQEASGDAPTNKAASQTEKSDQQKKVTTACTASENKKKG